MRLNHDTRVALADAVDLLNTAPGGDAVGDGGGERGGGTRADRLVTVGDLAAFVERNGLSGMTSLTEEDVAAVRSVRDRFARVLAAPDDRRAAELVNALVAEAGATPRLTDHDGHDWHVHYFAPGASPAQHLAADCGMALAFLIVSGERDRLRRCAAPGCSRVFADLSRNRSRRYCDSRRCGNRLHVAAYRARQREAAEAAHG